MSENIQKDSETVKILTENQELADLIGHRAWKLAREKLTQKVLDLQNAFNVDDKDERTLFLDIQARKMASLILFDWLKELEGSVAVVEENKNIERKSYIMREN